MNLFISLFIAIIYSTAVYSAPKETFQLTKENVQDRLLNSSTTILAAQNRVKRAKLNVEAARGRLFPSLNLGVVAGTLANPSFVLASVDYVLPFLIPQRWFDLKKAKKIQLAEKEAFFITEANLLASTFSLIFTIENDIKTRNMILEDLNDSILIEELVSRNLEFGKAVAADLNRAKSQTAATQIRLSKINELLIEEVNQLKYLLDLPQNSKLVFQKIDLLNPQIELTDWKAFNEQVKSVSPERRQVVYLTESAMLEKKSKFFGFISGASAGNSVRGISPDEQASFAFSNQIVRGTFNFGLDYFPNIDIADSQVHDLSLRLNEIDSETARATYTIFEKYDLISKRLNEAKTAELLLEDVFHDDKQRYELGEIPLIQIFDSQSKLRLAAIERNRADTDIKLIWLSAHRLLLTDNFSQIKGCEVLPRENERKKFPWSKPEKTVCDASNTQKKFSGN